MFNVDGKEFITLVLIALVVLGPEKLPDVFRRAGRLYSEVKRMSDGFQAEFQRAIEEPMNQVAETRDLVRESVDFRLSDDTTPNDHGTNDNGTNGNGTTGSGTTGARTSGDTDSGRSPDGPAPGLPTDVDVDADANVGAVDPDQAEVERRIADMERAGVANAGAVGTDDQPDPVGDAEDTE